MIITSTVASWLGGAVLGDAYTRAVSAATRKSEYKRLRERVQMDTHRKLPRERFERWYLRDDTWQLLTTPSEESYGQLCDSLRHELWEEPALLRRRPGYGPDDRVVEELVSAIIGHFVASQDSSTAVAIEGHKSKLRDREILGAITDQQNLDERIANQPPTVMDALVQLRDNEPAVAGRLLSFFDGAVSDPRTAVFSLMAGPVPWLADLPEAGFVGLARFAESHNLCDEASTFYEMAADTGVNRVRNLTYAAALAARGQDVEKAKSLVEVAKLATEGEDVLLAIVEAAIERDVPRVLAFRDVVTEASDPLAVGLMADALIQADRRNEALELLRRSADDRPELSGRNIAVAQLLFERAVRHESPNRSTDLAEAQERALVARDRRRLWHGNSAEAVAVACHAAAVAYDHTRILQLGCTEPTGEAISEEARDPRVLSLVARAQIAVGNYDKALEAAVASRDEWVKELIAARTCWVRGPSHFEEGRRHAREAWAKAADESARFDTQLAAAALQEWPLPRLDELEAADDDLAALVLATSEHARGQAREAIVRLRQYRGSSEPCGMLLAQIYYEIGSIEESVQELRHVADQFNRPVLLITAAAHLMQAGQLDEARRTALDVLAVAGTDAIARRDAHLLLLQLAQQLRDWHEMERQARTIIDEAGPRPDYRWALVGALSNQGMLEDAWRVSVADGPLAAENPEQAALWTQLNCRFAPGEPTMAYAIELLERYIDDEEAALAIALALVSMEQRDNPSSEQAQEWNQALELFFRRYPESPGLFRITVNENFDELIAHVRGSLEPHAELFEETQKKVAAGQLPYGVLAATAARPYGAALIHRGAGCLLLYPADRSLAAAEVTDALSARDKSVVIDTSVLVTASFTDGLWGVIQRSFASLEITDIAFRDAVATDDFTQRGDGMSMGWNAAEGKPTVSQTPPEVLAKLRARSAFIEAAARNAQQVPWPTQQALSAGEDEPLDRDPRFWTWLSGLDRAKTLDMPYLCDDASLRQYARSEGVSTFGSAALLEALERQGNVSAASRASMFATWRSEFCVDLPGTDELLDFARATNFEAAPATLTVQRSAFWQDPKGLACYLTICREAARSNPDQVPLWLFAAITGLSANRPPAELPRVAVGLLLQTTDLVGAFPHSFAKLVQATREALKAAGMELLLDSVFEALLHRLGPVRKDFGPQWLLALTTEMSAEDKEIARRVAFGGSSQGT